MTTTDSLERERAVLGALMGNNQAFDDVVEVLSPGDFASKQHRQVFEAIAALADQGEPFDALLLAGKLPGVDLSTLAAMQAGVIAPANAVVYARSVKNKTINRQLRRAADEVRALADTDLPAAEKVDQAQGLLQAINPTRAGGLVHIKDAITAAVDRIDELYHSDNPITGLPTGLLDLDSKTSGLQPGELIIVAGRPSMGKTAFAMNIAEHAVIKARVPVAVFSLEMPRQQLVMRMFSSLGRIDHQRVRTGRLNDDDWPRLTSATSLLSKAPLFVDDTPALTATELRARARCLKREHDLGLIVIDYLQLMTGPGENRNQEVAKISASLKALAKELNVPVVVLSQLNRGLMQRPDKRPNMGDLRDSGAIEQDADLVLLLYRDEAYNPDSPRKGIAELIIGKHRNGELGTVFLTFLGEHTRFANHAGPVPRAERRPTQARPTGFDYAADGGVS